MAIINYSSELRYSVDFLFGLVLLHVIVLFKAMLLVVPVNLNYLLAIFGVALIA